MNDHVDLIVDRPDTEPAEHLNGGAPKAAPHSSLERLRKRRATFNRARHVDLDIPGYGGDLVARYRPLSWEEVVEIEERVAQMEAKREPRATLYGQVDTLIRACEGIFLRDTEKPAGEDLSPIDGEGTVVRYEDRLAELLGFEAGTARKILLDTFPNDMAAVSHHAEFVVWTRESSAEVDDELLGE